MGDLDQASTIAVGAEPTSFRNLEGWEEILVAQTIPIWNQLEGWFQEVGMLKEELTT